MSNKRQLGGALLAGLLMFGVGLMPLAHAANYATGGAGGYRNQILWLTWGGGTNGTHGQAISVGSTSSSSSMLNGVPLNTTCTITSITRTDGNGGTGGGLISYRPGTWTGDGLDNLYNIGGTGTSNQLVSGIALGTNLGRAYQFGVSCSATLNGVPYDLPGLVVADAEQSAILSSGSGIEYVEGAADGNWHVLERSSGGTCSTRQYIATLSANSQTLRLGAGATSIGDCANYPDPANYGPMAVGSLKFNTTAYTGAARSVNLTFRLAGNGVSAVAFGLLTPYADFSDAPDSYGRTAHLIDLQLSNDGLSGGSSVNVMAAGFTLSQPVSPTDNTLGAVVDNDAFGFAGNAAAMVDDASGTDDEDGVNVSTMPPVSTGAAGSLYALPVTCTGTSSVRAWIDFNRDGDFADAGEASSVVLCASGTASPLFNIPATGVVPGGSYVRVRYSPLPNIDLLTPSGVGQLGEVEDHAITVFSQLRVAKQWVTAVTSDAANVTVSGSPLPSPLGPLATVANTANETDTATEYYRVASGSTYSIAEAFGSGLPANYAKTLACTGNTGTGAALSYTVNATTGTITVGSTATNILCTFTNTGRLADLQIVKTPSPTGAVVVGGNIVYTLRVTNNGPATATGAIVTDSVVSGLSCPSATTVTCTSPTAGACPAGSPTVGALTGAGVTMGTLAVGQYAELQFSCAAQ